MSSRQDGQSQRPMWDCYPQQNSFPTSPPNSGRELPQGGYAQQNSFPSTHNNASTGPQNSRAYVYNPTPRYQSTAYSGFSTASPRQSNIDPPQYPPLRAQPQIGNTNPNNYAPSTHQHSSGQTVHASHPPAAYGYTNHPQGPSRRRQGARPDRSTIPDADDEMTDDKISLIRGHDPRIPEKLHTEYRVERDQWQYFVPGRVFKTLFITTRGSDAPPRQPDGSLFDCGPYGHAKIQRFVVIMALPERQYSKCMTISTNGGTGTMKKKLDPEKQVIAYTSDSPPQKLAGERDLHKDAIKIEPVSLREKLDPASRIDLEKIHNVEHNVSVCHVGNVKQPHLRKLIKYYQNQLEEENSNAHKLLKKMERR